MNINLSARTQRTVMLLWPVGLLVGIIGWALSKDLRLKWR